MSELLLQDLKNAIAKGDAVFVIGSGVSTGATDRAPEASWQGLLHNGVERCEKVNTTLPDGWGNRQRGAIESQDMDELLGVAENVTRKLDGPGGGAYRRWLRETLEPLPLVNSSVLEALGDLGVVLATTNYDRLIERVTERPPVTWRDESKMERVFRGEAEGVAHLHGYYDEPESVILGIRSYEDVLRSEHAQQVLKSLVMDKVLVFVGCGDGLDDPNFGKLLQWMERVMKHTEKFHFRLALAGQVKELQTRHTVLRVLPYGNTHEALAPFLQSLKPALKAPPSATPPPIPTTPGAKLPGEVVGRDAENEKVAAMLCAEPPRRVAVLGTAGIGKSTVLAFALRRRPDVAARFNERRYQVSCDAFPDPAALWGAIGLALNLPLEQLSGASIEAAVLNHLRDAPAALVLDNFETPWDNKPAEAETILNRLSEVPHLALAVGMRSSRLPHGWMAHDAVHGEPLPRDEARRVFLNSAGEQFVGDPHLENFLTVLDGVPLALTLIAERAQGHDTLEDLWELWQELRVKIVARDGVEGKDADLATSYELSIHGPRVKEFARRFLSLLALLPDGVAKNDRKAIFPGNAVIAADMLIAVKLAYYEENRLRLLAPLREYVSQQYPPPANDLNRMYDHYLKLAVAGGNVGTARFANMSRLAGESGNVDAVLRHALNSNLWRRAVDAAWDWSEFVRFTGVGLAASLRLALNKCQAEGDEKKEAHCLQGLGNVANDRSEHQEAIKYYQSALTLCQSVGDVWGEANCIFHLGNIARAKSEYEEARQKFEIALPLYQREGDVVGEANCISSLGEIAQARSEYEEAHKRYEVALSLFQRVGDVTGEALCLHGQGRVYIEQQPPDYAKAESFFQDALKLAHRVGHRWNVAWITVSLGELAIATGDNEKARQLLEEALTTFRSFPTPHWIGKADKQLARLETGEHKLAHLCAARRAWQKVGLNNLIAELETEYPEIDFSQCPQVGEDES